MGLHTPPRALNPDNTGWMLDPSVDFLNHGSFGARLWKVREAQRAHVERFEAQPIASLGRRGAEQQTEARRVLGAFLGMAPDDFGFTSNATDAVTAVLRSLAFAPGDEVLTTNHVYNGVRQTTRHVLSRSGAVLREIGLAPPFSADAVRQGIADALGPQTRLLVLAHVTSPTALRFPVEAVAEDCRARGVEVLIDGAHGPGMLDLDISSLGVAFYAANLHKWLCAPPGAGLLWVRPDRQAEIHPNVVSHPYGEGLAAEFMWQGTRDTTPWLAAADAVGIVGDLAGPGGWPAIRAHNHALACWMHEHLCALWEVEPLSALDGSMLGSMAAVRLPERARARFASPEELGARLIDVHGIEVPCFAWDGLWLVRPCCHVYNRAEQYVRLGEAVLELLG